jgi:copper chaperone NosL
MKAYVILCILILVSAPSCKKGPEPILFGVQECAYCRMTITDKAFAAQVVTQTGRTYSFDAIECMLFYSQKSVEDETLIEEYFVADWNPPHNMLDAEQAYYVISEARVSPMGGNLSAYSTRSIAEQQLKGFDGEIYDWKSLWNIYLDKRSAASHVH